MVKQTLVTLKFSLPSISVLSGACRDSESMIRDSNVLVNFLKRPRGKIDSNRFL